MAGLGENSGGNDVEKFYSQIEKALDQRIAQNKDSYEKGSQDVVALKKDVLAILKEEGALEDLRLDASDLLAVYQNPQIQDLCGQLGIKSFDDFWRELGIVRYSDFHGELAPAEYAEGVQSVLINGIEVPVVLPPSPDRKDVMAIERLVGKIKAHTELHRYFNAESKIVVHEYYGYLRFEVNQDGKKQPYMVTATHFFKILYEPTPEQVEEFDRVRGKFGDFVSALFDLNEKNKSFAEKGEAIKKRVSEESDRLYKAVLETTKKLVKAKQRGEGVDEARAERLAAKTAYEGPRAEPDEEAWKVAVVGNKDYEELYNQYKHFKDLTISMQKNVIPWTFLDIESGREVKSEMSQNPGDLSYEIDGKRYEFVYGLDRYDVTWEEEEESFRKTYNGVGKLTYSSVTDHEKDFDVIYNDDGSFVKSNRDRATDIEVQELIFEEKVLERWWQKGHGDKYYKGEVYDKFGAVVATYKTYEDGNYEWEYLDPKTLQVAKKTGSYFTEGVEGDYVQIFRDGTAEYGLFWDKKYGYQAEIYDNAGGKFDLYNVNYPTPKDYVDKLATELNTPEKLALYFDLFFRYAYDDVREQGTRYAKDGQDRWQSPEETMTRIQDGMMEGDCEDLALLAADILKKQGKNAKVVRVFAHAACFWSEKREDGQYDFYSLDTGGLVKITESSVGRGLSKLVAAVGGKPEDCFEGAITIGELAVNGRPFLQKVPQEIFSDPQLYSKFFQANTVLQNGNFADALYFYNQICSQYPDNLFLQKQKVRVEGLADQASINACIQNIEKPEVTFDQCAQVDKYYEVKGMEKERVSWNLKLVERFPKKPDPYIFLMTYFSKNKNYQKSFELVEKALSAMPEGEKLWLHKYRVDLYMYLKRSAEVVKAYEEGKAELGGKSSYEVASYLEKNGREALAKKIYKDLIFDVEGKAGKPGDVVVPAFPGVYLSYAKHLLKDKDKVEAGKIVDLGLKYYGKDKNLLDLKKKIEGKAKLEVQGEKKYQNVKVE